MTDCICGHDRGEHERDLGGRGACMVAVGVLECRDGELFKGVAACQCDVFEEDPGVAS